MIRWVVFDVGGVVIDITPQETFAELSRLSGLSFEKISEYFAFKLDKTDDAKTFYDLAAIGRVTVDEYIRSMQWEFPNKVSREEIIAAELLTLKGDKVETIELMQELKSKVGLACYSNTHQVHWDHLLGERSWYALLDHVFASHTHGLAKPDPAVWAFMENELGIKPSEAVLIDDNERNIASARKAGWHAVHFVEIGQVRAELSKLLAQR